MATSKTTAPKAEKTETKPKVAKAPKAEAQTAAKPAATKKAPAAKPAAKTAAPKQERVVDGKIKVTQLIGTIARRWDQEATLKGLGLNKRGRSKVLENSPEVRGMVYKVRHLVKVEKVS